ncbi:hypothetical protein GCM10009801_60730 [Streptomyces albiaxialis]|uniref:SnoaL-like domain-containing protein n=1 Tax=Streptomyces albiaxialis TaxID=329523 RepID=A0ABN2WK15_9ACTN
MNAEEILTGMARAWNAGDGAGWAAHFAPDADFVDAVGRVQHGRDVIGAEHQKIFDTIYRGSELELRLRDTRRLGEDVYLMHSTSSLDVPAGPRAGHWEAIQTKIVQDGLILAFHNTALVDLADVVHEDEELARRSPQEWRHA